MAKILSVKDLSSFQIVICGCATIFEASYNSNKSNSKFNDCKPPTGKTIPVRIDALVIGKT